ncbi:hypothetical protein NHX12_024604 [Muraenolepis orangiensis]|uniref:Uncharacterized protein n=1 Tax=Muraenolepis orangiensis TaxID=630683 RepID=A0A9Q0EJP4_9TELE|nr:hypothetical protein NHX12_024604 [Muraenolepis orangiensis]
MRDAGEGGPATVSLGKVDGTGEEERQDSDEQEEDEQAQLPHASAEGPAQELEALRVAGQLEDPEDPYQADHTDDGQRGGRRHVVLLGQLGAQRRSR